MVFSYCRSTVIQTIYSIFNLVSLKQTEGFNIKTLYTKSTHNVFSHVAWLEFLSGLCGRVIDISFTLLLILWHLLGWGTLHLYYCYQVTSCIQHSSTHLPPDWKSNQAGLLKTPVRVCRAFNFQGSRCNFTSVRSVNGDIYVDYFNFIPSP